MKSTLEFGVSSTPLVLIKILKELFAISGLPRYWGRVQHAFKGQSVTLHPLLTETHSKQIETFDDCLATGV